MPVAGRRFDLVVSNPPFVAGPGTTEHTYRDSGRPGDAVCAELVAAAPGLLTDGGHMQFLANWLHVTGEQWEDRVADWLAGTGLDAWVIQREVSDPVAYVNLWLTDAAEDPARQPAIAAAWLDWFDAQKVDAVGFGLITLRAGGHDDPTVRIEDLRQTVDGSFGPLIGDWFARQDFLRSGDLLGTRFVAAPGLTLRQEATRGPDGWEVGQQVLSLPDGLRWNEEVDPVALTLVGACDGSVTLRDQVDVLAAAHGVPAEVLADVAVPSSRTWSSGACCSRPARSARPGPDGGPGVGDRRGRGGRVDRLRPAGPGRRHAHRRARDRPDPGPQGARAAHPP